MCGRPPERRARTADRDRSVEYLIEHKLRPLGVLARLRWPRFNPAFGAGAAWLTLDAGVVPTGAVRAGATVLRPLFVPPVVVGSLAAMVAADWLLPGVRSGSSVGDVVTEPAVLLFVVMLTLVAGAFHELGHATASRYCGAEPGTIGAGIYLI